MRSNVFALAAAGFAALAQAYTTPTTGPEGNPITRPLIEVVPAGKPFDVTWTPTTTGTVSLVLLRGPAENIKPLYAIAEGIANSGSFSWTPKTDLENDSTHYGLQIIDDATGQYQYSTQFGISGAGGSSSSSASGSASASSYVSSSASASVTPASNATVSSSAVIATSSAASSGFPSASKNATTVVTPSLTSSNIVTLTSSVSGTSRSVSSSTAAAASTTATGAAAGMKVGGFLGAVGLVAALAL